MAYSIEFQDVCKRFEGSGADAVSHASFRVEHGEFLTILGSSGCGKTTLLKMVNRLYEPDSGKILFFGRDVSLSDPVEYRRGIGYVIQQAGLFPHMTIEKNIGLVPGILKWEEKRIRERTEELMELVGLKPSEYRGRYPSQLSGGQQQRVGLARALAADPEVMLLDEPFGAVDAITRLKLQDELSAIHKASKKTFLFVTHDINEAFKLGTKVMIMDQGQIRQYAPAKEILAHPADGFVKSLIDSVRRQEAFWKEIRE